MTSVPMARSLSRNLVVNVIGPLVLMAVSFVTVPLYIHAIGAARYGMVTLTWILLGYLGVLDFGLSRAAANALGKLAHASSRERTPVLVTTLYMNLLFGLTAGAVFYGVGGTLLGRWFPLSGELGQETMAAFPWMAPMLPLGLLSAVAIGALDSRERFLLSTTLNSCGAILGQVLPLVCVMIFGPTLTVIIPALMLVRLGVVVAMLAVVFWLERPICSFAPDFAWARKLFGYGAWVSVSSLISPILATLDQMIIGWMLGAAAVAHYAVPMNFAIRSQVLAQALARTLFPRLSRETVERGRHLTGRATLSLIYVFGAVCGPAIVVIGPFLDQNPQQQRTIHLRQVRSGNAMRQTAETGTDGFYRKMENGGQYRCDGDRDQHARPGRPAPAQKEYQRRRTKSRRECHGIECGQCLKQHSQFGQQRAGLRTLKTEASEIFQLAGKNGDGDAGREPYRHRVRDMTDQGSQPQNSK